MKHALSPLLLVPTLALAPALAAPLAAQEGLEPQLTLERLHESGDFRLERFGPVRWLEDGGYTSLERVAGGGQEIVRHDPETGSSEVLVSAQQLTPEGAERSLGVSDYVWSADSRKLLVFTNTRRVWRRNTRGDYWVLDRDTNVLTQLGEGFEEARLQFAKFSPDATRVAYVYLNDLYVEELAGGEIRRLTEDGSPTRINGTFDWVYEEEWGLRDGFRWGPNGRYLASWQIDASGVREFTMVDTTSELYPKLTAFPYPKAGETNPACRIGSIDLETGAQVWMDLPGELRDDYVARMEWAGDGHEVLIQRVNRRQDTNLVLLGDVRTGEVRELFRDRDPAWVQVNRDPMQWLDGGRSFLWMSEQDGWRHLYRVDRNSGDFQLLTPGDYDVISLEHVDEENDWAYFLASPDNATQRFLYRVRLNGTDRRERVTPEDMGGSHGYQISQDAAWAIHTHSSFGVPPVTALVRLPSHEVVERLVSNDEARLHVENLARGPSGFFRVDIGGGVELDGWFLAPPGFDESKKYPVLFHVYGEPAGQTVLDRWGGGNYLWHLFVAQQGYVVVSVDNRGTPAPRGREWRKCVYGQVGILASADQAAAVRALQQRWSWFDGDRVAIWGWSGGGSMTLNALFRYPDLYRVGISVAPVSNQRYYDTIYQERYMGRPQDNPDGYRDGSPITFAGQLEGDLLLIHGTGDDNVHYQNTEALVDELVRHGKPFQMMAYPNRSHGIGEGRGTRKHLYSLMTRFLREHLPAGPSGGRG